METFILIDVKLCNDTSCVHLWFFEAFSMRPNPQKLQTQLLWCVQALVEGSFICLVIFVRFKVQLIAGDFNTDSLKIVQIIT